MKRKYRREIVEAYIKRLNDLEAIAMSYPGVTKTYAIQAGLSAIARPHERNRTERRH